MYRITYPFTICVLIFVVLFAAGCSSGGDDEPLPTLMKLPSSTPVSSAPTEPPTLRPFHTLPPTWTATFTHTPTATDTATPEPSVTLTASVTASRTATLIPTVAGDAFVSGAAGVNLRLGPSTIFDPPVVLLEAGTALFLRSRLDDNSWLGVETAAGQRGWVYAELIEINGEVDVASLPIYDFESPTPRPQPTIIVQNPQRVDEITPAAQAQPTAASADNAPLYYSISQRARTIYQQGQSMGNRSNFYTKVGDSITANQAFMIGYASGEYDMGGHGYLQETINYFSASHGHSSAAAASAFNAAAVLAAVWADSNRCNPNESPLMCEYRTQNPSIAIIMLGSVDVQLYSAGEFESYMNQIISSTISQGIIPVLTTFPADPAYHGDKVGPFNSIISSIAGREQIPLIDLRSPAMGLPGYGVGGDQYHLSQRGDSFIGLSGEQNQYGLTLRNYLTLEMLDSLRRGIPMR